MQEIKNIKDIQPNSTILLLDNDGKIKGIDTIKTINYENGFYTYKNQYDKDYEGNLLKYLSDFKAYFVSKDIKEYNDENFNSSLLNLEWVFENCYGESIGSFLRSHILDLARTDFNKRIELMNFIKNNENTIYKIRWEFDPEVGVKTIEELNACIKDFKDKLNVTSFFN